MAQQKIPYKVEIMASRMLFVYCNDILGTTKKIKNIEGVINVVGYILPIIVMTNPCYEIGEIKEEIEALLTPIPDEFKNILDKDELRCQQQALALRLNKKKTS